MVSGFGVLGFLYLSSEVQSDLGFKAALSGLVQCFGLALRTRGKLSGIGPYGFDG